MGTVEIERYVEQVQDGEFYKGHVKIGVAVFTYRVVLPTPIARLDNMMLTPESGNMRDFFQIALQRGGREIELSDEEYGFFYSLLNEFVVNFYHSPQTRGYNEGILQRRGEGKGVFDLTVPLSMTKKDTLHLSDEMRKMLSNPKFGSAF